MRGALLGLIAILLAIAVFQALKPLWIGRDYDLIRLAGLTIGILPLALPVVVIGIVLTLRPLDFGHFQTEIGSRVRRRPLSWLKCWQQG